MGLAEIYFLFERIGLMADALERLVGIAKMLGDKPVINVNKRGQLGVYTDNGGMTEWAKLDGDERYVRQSQLLSYLRTGQIFWLGAYIGHLNLEEVMTATRGKKREI